MENNKIRISCAGSSNTDGWPGTLDYTPFTYFLQFLLGESYEVMNFGKYNTTATFSMDDPYIINEKYRDLMVSKPDIVTLKLGGNDSKNYNWKLHGKYFKRDYSILVDRILSLGTKPAVLLCTPTRILPDNPYKILLGGVLEKEIVPQIIEVARERDLKVLDFHNLLADSSFFDEDNIHLNNKGHEAAAGIIFDEVKNLNKEG